MVLFVVALGAMACGDSRAVASHTNNGVIEQQRHVGFTDSALLSLSHAAGGVDGTTYVVQTSPVGARAGALAGRLVGGGRVSLDATIEPTHDLTACKPFAETVVPSRADGVGNAVVWLVGVTTGPADITPRRITLRLGGCKLIPRLQRVAVGGTVLVSSLDAMTSRLRFSDAGRVNALRETVRFNDAGQVVPTSLVASTPGLVEVRDDLHPWVHGWLAVTPHPFVIITADDGQFRFDGVPTGTYTLVAWSEKLGTQSRAVHITVGVETRVELKFD